MKKFVTTVALAGIFAIAGSANAATFVYQGGLIKMGSTGTQVYNLQSCLVDMGVNSSANVDGIFGSKTKAAVMAFQVKEGVAVDGIIGPVTGPRYTAACLEAMAEDKVEEAEEEVVEEESNPFPTTGGDEASLEDYDLDSENDAEEGSMKHVATVEFDVEDGDVMIERLDLSFDNSAVTGSADTRPWRVFDTLTLKADGKEIAEVDLDDRDDWRDTSNPFGVRVNNLKYVVEEGNTAKIKVYLTAQKHVDDNANANWSIFVDNNGVRAIDTAGITQYVGKTTDTVSFNIDSEGGNESIKMKSSSNNPDATTFKIKENTTSDWHEAFVFDLEAKENDIKVETLTLRAEIGNVTTAYAPTYNSVVNKVKVKIGSKEFDDVAVKYYTTNAFTTLTGPATAPGTTPSKYAQLVFDIDRDAEIDADDKERVRVMVEFKKQGDNDGTTVGDTADNYDAGETIKFSTVLVEGEGVDDVNDNTTLNSQVHILDLSVAKVEVQSVTATATTTGTAAGFINFKIKVTADDDEDLAFQVAEPVSGTATGLTLTKLGAMFTGSGTENITFVKLSGDATNVISGASSIWSMNAGDSAVFALDIHTTDTGTSYVNLNTVAGITVDTISPALNV